MDLLWFNEQVEVLNKALQPHHLVFPELYPVECQPEIPTDLAVVIDHTLLRPEATYEQIKKELERAGGYRFASVCIHPRYVSLAAEMLCGTGIKVCTVIGFPLGANTTLTKVNEARDAIAAGAEELDMVLPIGALKSEDYHSVYEDIASVKAAAGSRIVKVILETPLLSDAEIVKASLLAKAAGADFVKTATGFAGGGATIRAVELMRQAVGKSCGVKASGGIRDRSQVIAFLKAGADRIGTSAGVAIADMSAGEE